MMPLGVRAAAEQARIGGSRLEVTCDDCYFRQAGLCALLLERPCPTFRVAVRGALVPPRHPHLVARTLVGTSAA